MSHQLVKSHSRPTEVRADHAAGPGTVTRGRIRERAVELASIHGRHAQEVSGSDWEEAKRQLTVDPELDLEGDEIDAAPENERWDSMLASTGSRVAAAAGEDEDGDGRSDQERLINEGMAGAEQDIAREAESL